MYRRTNTTYKRSQKSKAQCFDIPIECIRKIRSLNIDRRSTPMSRELYKIIKSDNGRKMFSGLRRIMPWA
ncbi:hypothetical protein ACFL28_02375 [Candidatus Omnitrophota bacterium]